MAYDEKRKSRDRDGERENHDRAIQRAAECGKGAPYTDAGAEGEGYLGIDDLDRIRRKRLAQQTK